MSRAEVWSRKGRIFWPEFNCAVLEQPPFSRGWSAEWVGGNRLQQLFLALGIPAWIYPVPPRCLTHLLPHWPHSCLWRGAGGCVWVINLGLFQKITTDTHKHKNSIAWPKGCGKGAWGISVLPKPDCCLWRDAPYPGHCSHFPVSFLKWVCRASFDLTLVFSGRKQNKIEWGKLFTRTNQSFHLKRQKPLPKLARKGIRRRTWNSVWTHSAVKIANKIK